MKFENAPYPQTTRCVRCNMCYWRGPNCGIYTSPSPHSKNTENGSSLRFKTQVESYPVLYKQFFCYCWQWNHTLQKWISGLAAGHIPHACCKEWLRTGNSLLGQRLPLFLSHNFNFLFLFVNDGHYLYPLISISCSMQANNLSDGNCIMPACVSTSLRMSTNNTDKGVSNFG